MICVGCNTKEANPPGNLCTDCVNASVAVLGVPDQPPPPAPFSDNTEVTIEWETSARCYVQIDGFDVVVLDFIRGQDTVNVQVWDRLHGETPEVAATVDVKFHD